MENEMTSVHQNSTESKLWKKYAGIEPPERCGEYKSCAWLEGGLAFLYGDVMLCCARATVVEKHVQSHPSISKVLAMRKEIIAGLQNNNLSDNCSCKNCLYLEKRKWAPRPYLFDYITVAHYGTCNIRCSFCNLMHNRSLLDKALVAEKIPVLPFFKSLIKEKLLSPYATVNISGGEPALFPEFEDMVRLLAPKIGELIIFSNGTLFSQSIYDSFKYGSISLILSLDSAIPKTYQTVKGRDLCDKAWENAAKYASVGKDRVIAKMILMDENHQEIQPFIERAKNCGLKMLYYDFLRCGNSSPKAPYAAQAIAEFRYHALKNNIPCSNAQAGYIKDVEDEAEKIFQKMLEKDGTPPTTCKLVADSPTPCVHKPVILSAITSGYDPTRTEYKFLSKFENEEWTELSGYSVQNTYRWVPKKKGAYALCVYLKDMESARSFNDYSIIELNVADRS